MQENYLAKWLNNELSEQELSEFKKSEAYASYRKIAAISKQLEAPAFDVKKALHENKMKRSIAETKIVRLNPLKNLMRVAAVAAIVLMGSYFYLNSLDETVKTHLAQNDQLVLPDASEVILNADSKIAFNKNNWNSKRTVTLEGEAFFKVSKGNTFSVETSDGVVTVLGTQFNVENRKGFYEVTCYEGLVSVNYEGKNIKLAAGSSFLVINNQITQTESSKALEPSWVNNESSFKGIPLLFVLKELERQYNIKFNSNNVDTTVLFTGTFTNKNIELALKSICLPYQIKFKLEKNKVLLYAENAP